MAYLLLSGLCRRSGLVGAGEAGGEELAAATARRSHMVNALQRGVVNGAHRLQVAQEPQTQMSQYKRGRQAEYWARDQLLQDGFHTVVRSAASKGPIDLVAIGKHLIKLVQVKRTARKQLPRYGEDLDALRALDAEGAGLPECVVKELWIFSDERKAWVIVQA